MDVEDRRDFQHRSRHGSRHSRFGSSHRARGAARSLEARSREKDMAASERRVGTGVRDAQERGGVGDAGRR